MEPSLKRFSTDALVRMLNSINGVRFLDDTGEIEFFRQKAIILPRDSLTVIRKQLEKVSGKAGVTILTIAGRSLGTHHGRLVVKSAQEMGLQVLDMQLLNLALHESNLGFGKMSMVSPDLQSSPLTIQVRNSFEAMEYGKSNRPVCTFTKGFLEGLFETLLGRVARANETSCLAKGDHHCEFQVSTNADALRDH